MFCFVLFGRNRETEKNGKEREGQGITTVDRVSDPVWSLWSRGSGKAGDGRRESSRKIAFLDDGERVRVSEGEDGRFFT